MRFLTRDIYNCTHANVSSQTIMCPNPNPNLNQNNNLLCKLRITNANTSFDNSRKGTLFVGFVLGLGILNTALFLVQCLCNDVCSFDVTREKRVNSSARSLCQLVCGTTRYNSIHSIMISQTIFTLKPTQTII